MKTLAVIVLLFLYNVNVKSQNNNELVFTNQLNQLVSDKSNASPTIYEVSVTKFKETINTSSKNITKEYRDVLEQLNLALRDSITAVKNKESLNLKHEALDEITMYVNNYLNSNEDYEFKKEELIDAQLISNEYKLGYLLYADAKMNPHYEDKFMALSIKKSEMKSYLKHILARIDSNKEKISLNKDSKLKQLREKLRTTQQYEIVKNKADVVSYDSYVLGNSVANPEGEITGQFEALGRYYVLNNGVNGHTPKQLVSAIKVRQEKIKKENFLFRNSAVLIMHKRTKKAYLVRSGFVNQYAINKVASKAEFNGKTSLPNKIYKSKEDKMYDALIISYNKSQIASMSNFD